ncbi:MAG: gliding motility protein GldL [Bacteroidales bacterium]|nr:gliding motility protein GldL [Bacteroidales bacterium]
MSITELVHSKGFKNFMSKVYGIGASVVLLGALFKIQHWPGASLMLIIGLSTEAFIFFMSAWEPPHQEWDWSLVYPQLAGIEEEITDHEPQKKEKNAIEKLQELLDSAQISPELFNKLSAGLKELSNTTEKLSDISNAAIATNRFSESFNAASAKINEFTNSYIQSSNLILSSAQKISQIYETKAQSIDSSIDEFTASLLESGKKIAQKTTESINKTISHIDNSITEFTAKVNESGKQVAELYTNVFNETLNKVKNAGLLLSEAYNTLATSIISENEITKSNIKTYNEQIQLLVKNITAINSLYEIQLQSTNQYIDNSKKLFTSLDNIMQNMASSTKDVELYRNEISKLAHNLAALNTIYGNMLAAMNFSLKQ